MEDPSFIELMLKNDLSNNTTQLSYELISSIVIIRRRTYFDEDSAMTNPSDPGSYNTSFKTR